jgi:gliding motility-associated-like protein
VKKLLLIFILVLTGFAHMHAQYLSAGADTSICPGQSVTLTAGLSNSPGGPLGGVFAPPTNVTLCGSTTGTCDDSFSPIIPIGFSFTFYGNTYTSCIVGTNGVVSFNTAQANGGCQWSIGANCPSPSNLMNCIMIPWQDNYLTRPPQVVRYKTTGVAPNRIFVVEFIDVEMYGCWSGNCNGNQVLLKETSNIIETHLLHKKACPTWNGGRAIHGTHNSTGTIAHIVPGRNGLDPAWGINDPAYPLPPSAPGVEGRRWTPLSASSYSISVIPCAPLSLPPTLTPGTITWSVAGGAVIGTGASVTVSPATTTSYVASIPYSGCGVTVNLTDTVRINMGSLPLTTSPNATICYGDTAQLYVNTVIPGTTNYVWTPNSNINNNTLDTILTYPTASTTYTVTATNGACSSTATVSVNVNPLPVPGVNPINPQICQGSSVNMTASGGTNYVWSPGTGLNTTVGATVTASPTTTTPYTIVVTDANGCVDSMVNTVTFFPNPTVTASSAAPGVCLTFNTQLNANGAVNYAWSPAAGLSATNIANPTASPLTTTNYQVIGTDANGCMDTAFVNILVYPNPVAGFTAPVTASCAPLTVSLLDNSNISSGTIASYLWNVETMGSSNLQNPGFTFTSPGDYDVNLIVVSDQGCTDTLTIVDYLHAYSVPTAGFFATPNPATLGDALISFTNTSSLDAVNFLWDMGGLATINATNPEYEFNYADTFNITLIAVTANGCSDTVSSTVIVEDVSEIWIPNSFTPNFDGLNESWFPRGRNFDQGNVTIEVEVFDRWGMLVFASNDASKQWNGKVSATAVDCPQDVYVYRIYFVNEQGKEFTYSGHVSLIR